MARMNMLHKIFAIILMPSATRALLAAHRIGLNRPATDGVTAVLPNAALGRIFLHRRLKLVTMLVLSKLSDDASSATDAADDYSPDRKEGCVADKANHIRILDQS